MIEELDNVLVKHGLKTGDVGALMHWYTEAAFRVVQRNHS